METAYRKPARRFEKLGEVDPATAYHVKLDNVASVDKEDMMRLVDSARYFSIFAPRQSGKTTFFLDFCRSLSKDPVYTPILLNFQFYKELNKKDFYGLIQEAIYKQLVERLVEVQCEKLEVVNHFLKDHRVSDHVSFYKLFVHLNTIFPPKRIVILIDEFDGAPVHEIENFLSVLRGLYQEYKGQKEKALYSVGLVGIRNITKLVVGGASPFNIADAVSLPPFSLKNVDDLFVQYTGETNQPFTEEAVKKIHGETGGQPWLVNRLGSISTTHIKSETTEAINGLDVEKAISWLMDEKNSHFDNLSHKVAVYKDDFSRIRFNPVVYDSEDEAQSFLEEHGLIRNVDGMARVANAIYEKRFRERNNSRRSESTSPSKPPLLFLCHADEDKPAVRKLHKRLKKKGFNTWFDEEDILPGQNWDFEIRRAMKATDFALIILSGSSVKKRGYVNKEIKWVLDRQNEMPEGDIFLIPIKLEPIELPVHMQKFQAVDLYDPEGFERLVRALAYQPARSETV